MEVLSQWQAFQFELNFSTRRGGIEKKKRKGPFALFCQTNLHHSYEVGYSHAINQESYGGRGDWDTYCSSSLYRVNEWGYPYFAIDHQGHAVVRPTGSRDGNICLSIYTHTGTHTHTHTHTHTELLPFRSNMI